MTVDDPMPHRYSRAMGISTIVLAAGLGKRFKSNRPKILHQLGGYPLMWYPLKLSTQLRAQTTIVVVSPGVQRDVEQLIAAEQWAARTAIQREPTGTAGAVRAAERLLRTATGYVLILPGDVPLLRQETLTRFVREVAQQHAVGGVLTVELTDPTGYGRVVRGLDGRIQSIVEERDADDRTRAIREINTAVMCCEAQWLWKMLKRIRANNAQQEYYVTDIAALAAAEGRGMLAVLCPDAAECLGVNSRSELAHVERLLYRRTAEHWMREGVTLRNPDMITIDGAVRIGRDTILEAGVALRGATTIGAECSIDRGCVITNSRIGNGVIIKPYTVMDQATVGDHAEIGPFARLRPQARLDREVRVGNFVEIKKSWLKRGVKANHLTYLGDATIGAETNVGCGTITCNYDGVAKYPTIIGEQVFIGSDTQFVAPVRIGRGATTAAGSVITDDVPAGALAVGRGRQINKRHWKRKSKTRA